MSCVNLYGENTINTILNEPDRVKEEADLSDRQIKALTDGLNNGNRQNMLRQQFPELSAQQIKRVGAMLTDPVAEISHNPYCLTEIPGISFQLADAIGQRLGTDPRSPFRVNHALVHILKTDYADDLFVNLDNAEDFTQLIIRLQTLLKIRIAPSEVAQRLTQFAGIEDSPIIIERYNGEAHLYLSTMYNDMVSFIDHIHDLNVPDAYFQSMSPADVQMLIIRFEVQDGICLTSEQRNAAETAIKNNLSMTVDRLLVMSMNVTENIRRRSHNAASRFVAHMDESLFIIDESSMLDLQKTTALFNAFPRCHYVFVGDIDQLPPISPGHILKELIASGKVPVARLTKPLRNGGLILENADKVNNKDTSLKFKLDEFMHCKFDYDSEDALNYIIECYNVQRESVTDIQQLALLCPVRKGVVGTNNLNIRIQNLLCPKVDNVAPVIDTRARRGWSIYSTKGFEIPNTFYGMTGAYTKFRVGDIVMNTKNNYQIETTMYEYNDYWNGAPMNPSAGIFNGDCGKILAYVPNMVIDNNGDKHEGIIVQFFDGRVAQLDLVCGEFESFELGYAITVHKSQGCEYDSVVYVSPQSVERLTEIGFANHNLVYTAITRAKQQVMIIGSKSALDACITHDAVSKESTIAERI